MKDELDIVNQLIKNENPIDVHAPTAKVVRAPHEKHMDPVVKPKVAKENKKQEHWVGDTIKLSNEQKLECGLPESSYLVVKSMGNENASACVYDPIHWIYGWGEDTLGAVKDCVANIKEWRQDNPDSIADLIKGWEIRLEHTKHPYKFKSEDAPAPKTYQTKPIDSRSTTSILKELGL